MIRGILMGLALTATAFTVATVSLADAKPPADVVRAIRMTVTTPDIQVQAPANVQFPTERVCFPDRNVVCEFESPSVMDLIAGAASTRRADARFDETLCTSVADMAKKPKANLPSGLTIERIDVPGPLARKAFALAELNALRDEMMRDIAKQGIDAGVLHTKK